LAGATPQLGVHHRQARNEQEGKSPGFGAKANAHRLASQKGLEVLGDGKNSMIKNIRGLKNEKR
jgi:hypothetical protein